MSVQSIKTLPWLKALKSNEVKFGLALTLLAGAILSLCYFASPAFHHWMGSHLFTPLQAHYLTWGQGIVVIGLPTAIFSSALTVYLLKKPKVHYPSLKFNENRRQIAKQLKQIGTAALILTVVTGAILASLYLPILKHKIALDLDLATFAAPPLVLSGIVIGVMLYRQEKRRQREEELIAYTRSEAFQATL